MPVHQGVPDATGTVRSFLRRLRPKTVRARTVALLTVPVVALVALWALATASAAQNAWKLRQVAHLNTNLAAPIGELEGSLQAERSAVLQYLDAPRTGVQALDGPRSRTTTTTGTLLAGVTTTRSDIASLAPSLTQRVNTVLDDLDALQNDHSAIAATRMDWNSAYTAYTTAINDAFAVDEVLTSVNAGQSTEIGRADHDFSVVGEMIARQDAVVSSAEVSGQLTPAQFQVFSDAVGGQHTVATAALPGLSDADRGSYAGTTNSDSYRSLSSMQNATLDAGPGHPIANLVPADQWRNAVQSFNQGLDRIESNAMTESLSGVNAASAAQRTRAVLVGVLGLLAVLLTLVVSVRIGRALVRELSALHNSALELADRRLPQAMRRLRAGEKIDMNSAVPLLIPGEGEIGEVGEALNAVQRAALQAAAERADLLTGVSGVFVNLARRSQSLIHRQLGMLDSLERRIDDPDMLEDLFRLDHLATRMRRHAESLIIMSGSTPGRTWSKPVPLTNVLRAAIAEVEEYARVEMRRMPDLSIIGSAVSDIIHLVAELVENATSFSPPNTAVLVHGDPVGNGLVVEIDDRGLGISPDRMTAFNQVIADAHRLELFQSDRLGLFVVSRLASRQNITVSLRSSPYGGTTAVVLLPTDLLAMSEPAPGRRLSQPEQFSGVVEEAPRHAATLHESGHIVREAPAITTRAAPPEPVWPAPSTYTETPGETETPANGEAPGNGSLVPASTGGESIPVQDTAAGETSSTGGLPRRKRQANLAPGLRTDGRERGIDDDRIAAKVSPEQALTMMSAFQEGTIRGRISHPEDFSDT